MVGLEQTSVEWIRRLIALSIVCTTACGGGDGDGEPILGEPLPAGFCQEWGNAGRFDENFGGNGGAAWTILVEEDGSVLVGGGAFLGDMTTTLPVTEVSDAALVRLNADGTRDGGWGTNGVRVENVSAEFGDRYFALARRPGGGVIAFGSGYNLISSNSQYDGFVDGLSASGEVDSSYCDGRFAIDSGSVDFPIAALVTAEGTWLAMTGTELRRFDMDCALDTSYASMEPVPGTLYFGRLNGDAWYAPDGVAFTVSIDEQDRCRLARITTEGTIDPSFGGTAGVDLGLSINSLSPIHYLARAPDGSTIVAGASRFGRMISVQLVRVDATGVVDPTFGTSGATILSWQGSIRGMTVAPDGTIYLVGTRELDSSQTPTAMVTRLTRDGLVDTGFGNMGELRTDMTDTAFNAVAVLPDGRIVAAGQSEHGLFVACVEP